MAKIEKWFELLKDNVNDYCTNSCASCIGNFFSSKTPPHLRIKMGVIWWPNTRYAAVGIFYFGLSKGVCIAKTTHSLE
jgi:hypothetical protein